MTLYHIALPEDWQASSDTGEYVASTRGATIAEVGYMHAGGSIEQVRRVAEAFYFDRPDAIVLVVDEERLAEAGLEVRLEPGDPDDARSEKFPHVYGGPIPVRVLSVATGFSLWPDSGSGQDAAGFGRNDAGA